MTAWIRRYIFGGKFKSTIPAQVFLVLCFYAAFTTVYALVLAMSDTSPIVMRGVWMRLIFGVAIIVGFVILERSKLNASLTAFLVPSYIVTFIFAGAYIDGDVLVFSYIIGAAMLTMTYIKPKSILPYLGYCVVVSVLLMLLRDVFTANGEPVRYLMGWADASVNVPVAEWVPFSMTHNVIALVVAVVLGFVVWMFCVSYSKNIKRIEESQENAVLSAKAKGNFLARMSHEIRTPLNAIIGLTETQMRKNLSKEDLNAISKIQTSGKLLLGIINDILDLSKIESGKFDLVPEDYLVADVVYDIVNLNMVRIGSKPINFAVTVDETIPSKFFGDSLRIKQLLNNLLSNAFKYTIEGRVELTLNWQPEGDGARVIFKVSDSGMGMQKEDLGRLFTEYSQANRQANKSVEGTGLGLSICKGLTDLMDGKIFAESEYGRGSAFTAEIMQGIADKTPLGEKNAAALADFSYKPDVQEEAIDYILMPYGKVLIVDDVQINLEVATAIMDPYQMQVDCLDNGKAAVEKIMKDQVKYDIIFMDHMMPGMDGIETADAIRALGTNYAKNIPIVALTANAIAGSDKMFAEHGFQGFLSKPIELPKLDAVLKKFVMKKKSKVKCLCGRSEAIQPK